MERQLMISSENSLRACLLFLPILSPIVSLFTTALAITLGWPNCSFRPFRAVAYIMPFDPTPEIARSASPFKSIRN